MIDWVIQNIEQLPIELIDGDRSSRYPKRSDYLDYGEIVFLNADSISSGKLDISKVNYLPERIFNGIKKGRLHKSDLVLTMRGNGVGKVAHYGINNRGLINAQMLIMRPNAEHIDSLYLYYYFLNPVFQQELLGYVSGSAQPQLTITHLKNVPITLPPLDEQRAIADILGSLDDKIEANRRQNETLEAAARAIFKSWFVDFDPVHAKARGEHPPDMDAETAALFPDSFEESELGLIPRGWEVGMLGEVIELAYGKSLTKKSRIDGDVPVYGSNGQVGWHNEALVNGPGIVVGRKGNPGTVEWVNTDFFPIDTTFYVVSLLDRLPLEFIYLELEYQNLPDLSADSAVPGLNRNIAYMNNIVLPTFDIVQAFVGQFVVLRDKIYMNERESRTLAETRDALLPRLVSGELRVGEL